MTSSSKTVGFIGLGDQGLPMATAIAEAGFSLHVWARHASSFDALGDTSYVRHDDLADLAAACDVVGLCVSTDDANMQLVDDGLLSGCRAGTILVNHGTGTPANASRLTERCAGAQVAVVDAPVSGGRGAAEKRQLTTLVGGEDEPVRTCQPVFETFSAHVIHVGGTGAGQYAKLFNNALLMLNQAAIADSLELAAGAGLDPVRLVESLKLGSATSSALTLLGTMVTPDTVDHLSQVEALDMRLFGTAMEEANVEAGAYTERGLSGAQRLPDVVKRLNP